MEIAVVLAEPHRNPEQAGKMLFREDRGLRPVREDAPFA
jgi:hypothetical protein